MKTFVKSKFNHFPLICMFHSRRLNNKINNVHEKALKVISSDQILRFQELLHKEASSSVHHRNIETLAVEIYKRIHGILPAVMGEVFKINRTLPYNLRIHNGFSSVVPKTVEYGPEKIFFFSSKSQDFSPRTDKKISCLEVFKSKIRKCKTRLSMSAMQNLFAPC